MKGILPDNNVIGHVRILVQILEGGPLRELWDSLALKFETFKTFELNDDSSDLVIWRTCQQQQLVLVTANRNADGPESLEETIRRLNKLDSLPVVTLADAERIIHERSYAERASRRLMEILFDIDKVRGAGRLFAP
jgi:hypothetical protein